MFGVFEIFQFHPTQIRWPSPSAAPSGK
jgi:hypothetical protein